MSEINRKELKQKINSRIFDRIFLIFGEEKMYVKADCEYLVEKLCGKNPTEFNFHSFSKDYDLDDIAVYDEDGVTETTVACYFDTTHNKNFAVPANSEAGLGQTGGYHLKTRSYFLAGAKAFLGRGGDYYYDITGPVMVDHGYAVMTFWDQKPMELFEICEDGFTVTEVAK